MRPHVYVTDLAAYAAGIRHGCWVGCDRDADQILAEIGQMLAASPVAGAEEWRIDDTEDFGGWHVGEGESVETLSVVARLITQHGDPLSAFIANEGSGYWTDHLDELQAQFAEAFLGDWESLAEYAASFIADCYDLSSLGQLADYLDLDRYARDLELGGDLWTAPAPHGHVYVFRS